MAYTFKSLSSVGLVIGLISMLSQACGEVGARPNDSAVAGDTAAGHIPTVMNALPLRVLGTEPFWALDVDSSGLKFTTPDDTSGIRFPPRSPTVTGDTVVWSGQTERATIVARVWAEKCSDGMSDREYPYAARVTVAGSDYRGCAIARGAIVGIPRS